VASSDHATGTIAVESPGRAFNSLTRENPVAAVEAIESAVNTLASTHLHGGAWPTPGATLWVKDRVPSAASASAGRE
jgi:hypothetical protein